MLRSEIVGLLSPGFVVDPKSIIRNSGRQVDFDYIPEAGASIVKAAAGAAAGATSITVDALPVAIPAGVILNFGNYAPVTVTVNDADVNAGETSITVAALSGPIPSGTRLEFSGAGAGYAQLTADADTDDTTLTVEALPEDIDNAATATFPGGTIAARLTVAAAAGATSITVDELPFAVANDAEAEYPARAGSKFVASGTIMAELSTGKIVPRSLRPGSETASCILETTAIETNSPDALTGYGCIVGGVLFENLLPDADGNGDLPSDYKTELAANGCGFIFEDAGNSITG